MVGGKGYLWERVELTLIPACWLVLLREIFVLYCVFLTLSTGCILHVEDVASAYFFTCFLSISPTGQKSLYYGWKKLCISEDTARYALDGMYIKFNKGQRRWLSLGSLKCCKHAPRVVEPVLHPSSFPLCSQHPVCQFSISHVHRSSTFRNSWQSLMGDKAVRPRRGCANSTPQTNECSNGVSQLKKKNFFFLIYFILWLDDVFSHNTSPEARFIIKEHFITHYTICVSVMMPPHLLSAGTFSFLLVLFRKI